eukprot:GILI01029223.1.p1 GENE.GILI01029223.1~~GILI01029223.1.p1  ORF type:complete len:234 (-),score=50.15 GILI01029223.1:96-797(-)
MQLPQCIGMIGGKPRFSLYFVGFQGEDLIYLDPHFVQPSFNVGLGHQKKEKGANSNKTSPSASFSSRGGRAPPSASASPASSSSTPSSSSSVADPSALLASLTLETLSSHRCTKPRKIPLCRVDPSLAIGFYIKDEADFVDFSRRLKEAQSGSSYAETFITLMETTPDYQRSWDKGGAGGGGGVGGLGQEDGFEEITVDPVEALDSDCGSSDSGGGGGEKEGGNESGKEDDFW